MNPWRKLFSLIVFLFFCSCSDNSVEQISVKIPPNLKVPEEMVYIPEGEFVYGHPSDPKTSLGKKVHLPAYFIDKFEVTRGDYQTANTKYWVTPGKELFPVNLVSFLEASTYCQSLGKRLPTEKEWEKAARGIDARKWPWKQFQEHPNNGFSGFIPEPVDKRDDWISPYGIYGMGHNVWEWTVDDYDFNGMPGTEKGKYKVIRGGLFQSHLTIKFSATWARNYMEPQARYNFLGFRCAKDLD